MQEPSLHMLEVKYIFEAMVREYSILVTIPKGEPQSGAVQTNSQYFRCVVLSFNFDNLYALTQYLSGFSALSDYPWTNIVPIR